jgi:hypothetical protein
LALAELADAQLVVELQPRHDALGSDGSDAVELLDGNLCGPQDAVSVTRSLLSFNRMAVLRTLTSL